MKPLYKHDCAECIHLGQTIGNGRLFDLYAHRSNRPGDISRDATVIARYGDNGPEYYSTIAQMARAEGHAELFAAASIWFKRNGYQ